MRILILGINYPPEEIGIAVYTGGLAESLAAAGHEVSVVTAKPSYPAWRVFPGYRGPGWRRSRENGVSILRCPLYVPSNPTGGRRILQQFSFALGALVPMLWRALTQRPALVLAVAPSLVASPVAWIASRLAGARCWLHIHDFEVEAAFATGLIEEGGLVARVARRFERAAIALFDSVSSISPEMCRKLSAMGVRDPYELRNWSDIEAVRPLEGPSSYRREWNVTTEHVALYAGNIANKQGIEIVAEAARRLGHRKDLTFVVCGEGPNRRNLEALAAGLDNIRFHDLQPAERLGELVGLATIHLLPQKAGAADLVLPSKLTNMLASGRPVVATAAAGTGLAREVEGCGLVTPPEQAAPFADAIERLVDDPDLHARLGRAARRRAETDWDRRPIVSRFLERIGAAPDAKAR